MLNEITTTEPKKIYQISMSETGLTINIKAATYYAHMQLLVDKFLPEIIFFRHNDDAYIEIPFPFINGTNSNGTKNKIDWPKINTCTSRLSQILEKLNKSFVNATPEMYLSQNPQTMIVEIRLDNTGNEIKVFLNSEVCNLLKANYFGIIRLSEIENTILRTYLRLTTTSQRTVDRTLISFKQNHGSRSVIAMINDGIPYFSAPAQIGNSIIGKLNTNNFDGFLESRDIESGIQILTLLSALASFSSIVT